MIFSEINPHGNLIYDKSSIQNQADQNGLLINGGDTTNYLEKDAYTSRENQLP